MKGQLGRNPLLKCLQIAVRSSLATLPSAVDAFWVAWKEEGIHHFTQGIFELAKNRCSKCDALILDPRNVELVSLDVRGTKWAHLECTSVSLDA